ncbi:MULTISPECIES: hypothetical protein [unclassified Anabaena]|uniref:hypothetical protein n=1 Tax=unclassified Anabaena TaxID=2619674 RepID=UPI00082D0599|nr:MULTISPECIES: hypothetical protein [unclassified Anabaena]
MFVYLIVNFDDYPETMVEVLRGQSQNYKKTPLTLIELLKCLSKQILEFTSKVLSSELEI